MEPSGCESDISNGHEQNTSLQTVDGSDDTEKFLKIVGSQPSSPPIASSALVRRPSKQDSPGDLEPQNPGIRGRLGNPGTKASGSSCARAPRNPMTWRPQALLGLAPHGAIANSAARLIFLHGAKSKCIPCVIVSQLYCRVADFDVVVAGLLCTCRGLKI